MHILCQLSRLGIFYANFSSMSNEPVWFRNFQAKPLSLSRPNTRFDVAIVGAGITGLTCAYFLQRQGREVALIDPRSLGGDETGATTAHATYVLDSGFHNLIKQHGKENAKLAFESHSAAINLLEQISWEENIACDFKRVDGYLMETSKMDLDQEIEAARELGFRQMEKLDTSPLAGFRPYPALRILRQARFHPLKYVSGLAQVLQIRGAVFVQDYIAKVDDQGAWTRGGDVIAADAVIIATDSPITGIDTSLKQAAYRSYAISYKIPKFEFPDALFWDTDDPYHYIRIQEFSGDENLLIVGGEDHKTGHEPEKPFEKLAAWTQDHFPFPKIPFAQWSGQVEEPFDGLAFIGRIPNHRFEGYVATGFSGNGMTYGTLAGKLISDLIADVPNPWEKIYLPGRVNLSMVKDFLTNAVDSSKHLIMDRGVPASLSMDDIAPGEGGIVQDGKDKLAVSRDKSGNLNVFSAVCPHMGCIIAWNPVAKSFDCPCHGSRFSSEGKLLHGPASKDLTPCSLTAETNKKSA